MCEIELKEIVQINRLRHCPTGTIGNNDKAVRSVLSLGEKVKISGNGDCVKVK